MPGFTRGLAEAGANVIGLGDQHELAVPEAARKYLAMYVTKAMRRGFSKLVSHILVELG